MTEARHVIALVILLAGIVAGAFVWRDVSNQFTDATCGRYAEARGWVYEGRRYTTRFEILGFRSYWWVCQFQAPEPGGGTRTVHLRPWRALDLPDLGLACLGAGAVLAGAGALVWGARKIMGED
jgi:hypothetical protein